MSTPSASMTVTLPPELAAFVESRLDAGRYPSVSEMIREGLRLLKWQESSLGLSVDELRAQVAIGIEQADRGELLDGEEVFEELEGRLGEASIVR